jgi:hypothetical protein
LTFVVSRGVRVALASAAGWGSVVFWRRLTFVVSRGVRVALASAAGWGSNDVGKENEARWREGAVG